jgi:peptidoglycan/LPS O-acetylase OafA/YrhL
MSAVPAGSPARDSPFVPALDGVRGLAILLVLAHNLDPFAGDGRLFERAADLIANFGWVGVQLFFVLSGYLISGILLDTRRAANYYRAFWGRRVLRIFPLYYAFLLICLVVIPALGLAPARLLADADNRIWLWVYLINWAEPLGRGVAAFPHFWSLAVEEQFYFVWPVVVRRVTPRGLLQVAVALAVIALAARIALLAIGFGEAGPYMFTICRMDALALGGAVAAVMRMPAVHDRLRQSRRGIAMAAAGLFLIGLFATRGYPRAGELDQTFGYTILAIAFAVLVLIVVLEHERGRGWIGAVFRNRVLRTFGTYSYAIYLFHQPINQMIGEPLLQQWFPRGPGFKYGCMYMLAVTAVSYVLAVLSYHGFEKHFLALKRYFVPAQP